MTNPTTSQKYLALAICLPVLADFIEDLRDTNVFVRMLAKKSNMLMEEIRKADEKFYDKRRFNDATEEEIRELVLGIANQQEIGGREFRKWVTNKFKDYDEEPVHSDGEDQDKKEEGDVDSNEGESPCDTKRKLQNSRRGSKKKSTDDAEK
jgi:hypothetical protein